MLQYKKTRILCVTCRAVNYGQLVKSTYFLSDGSPWDLQKSKLNEAERSWTSIFVTNSILFSKAKENDTLSLFHPLSQQMQEMD